MWIDLIEIFGPQTDRDFGQAERTPHLLTEKIYTAEELHDESVLLQSKFDDIKQLRKLVNDPMNKKYMGQSSLAPPEEVLPLPGNPIMRWEDFWNGRPEERFNKEKESKAKCGINF